jgi:hypothetical protein
MNASDRFSKDHPDLVHPAERRHRQVVASVLEHPQHRRIPDEHVGAKTVDSVLDRVLDETVWSMFPMPTPCQSGSTVYDASASPEIARVKTKSPVSGAFQ